MNLSITTLKFRRNWEEETVAVLIGKKARSARKKGKGRAGKTAAFLI